MVQPWLRSSPRAGSQAKGDKAGIATFYCADDLLGILGPQR
jgi:hypothetical protein